MLKIIRLRSPGTPLPLMTSAGIFAMACAAGDGNEGSAIQSFSGEAAAASSSPTGASAGTGSGGAGSPNVAGGGTGNAGSGDDAVASGGANAGASSTAGSGPAAPGEMSVAGAAGGMAAGGAAGGAAAGGTGGASGAGLDDAGSSAGGTSSADAGVGTAGASAGGQAGQGQAGTGQNEGGAAGAVGQAGSTVGMGGASPAGAGGGAAGVAGSGPLVGSGCNDSAIFCEDFESLAVGTAQASNGWSPEGNVTIDTEAIRGERSLRLQPNGGQFARIVLNDFAPPGNGFFGRMYVHVDQYPTAPNFAHYVLVEVTGTGSSERTRPVGGQLIQSEGLNMWGPGSDGGATGDWTNWQPSSPTRDGVWECVEWRMDDANDRMDVWIDEVFQADLSSDGNPNNPGAQFVFPQFNSIWFGWWVFQGGTVPAQFDVHLDDIVLSSERIGCD